MGGTIAEVYAQELASRGYGYPLWYPEGSKTGVPRIGDVGYISEGAFVRLLNVREAKDSDRYKKGGPPDNYVPLEYDEDELDDTRDAALQTRVISSQSVSHFEVSGNVQANGVVAGGGVGYKYNCSRERGALLLMKDDAKKEAVLTNNKFPEYMKKHHRAWYDWLQNKGHAMKQEQLILVRGAVKTSEWTVAAFQSTSGGHSANIQGTFVTAGSVGFELSKDTKNDGSVEYRSGPEVTRRSPSPVRSVMTRDSASLMPVPAPTLTLTHSRGDSASTIGASGNKYDQCVFVPHYRIKYVLGVWRRIKAAAGDDELPDPDDEADETQITIETDDQGNLEPDMPANFAGDPLDIVLDYILAKVNAEVAVVCEEDVNACLMYEKSGEPWPEDMQRWLSDNNPKIDLHNGLGTLSLVEAIQRGRRGELARMIDLAKLGNAAGGAGGGGGGPSGDKDADMGDGGEPPANPAGQRDVKEIVGEGKLLRGKYLPEEVIISWPHMSLIDQEADSNAVSSMALSPDGRFLATASDDSNVRLWNLRTGQLARKWAGHEDIVWSVAYSPDGCHIASGSADTTIMLWDPSVADEEYTESRLEGHEQDVWIVLYSPNGNRIASGSVDNTVKIWDVETKQEMHTLSGHASQVMHLAFVKDGTRIVSCADNKGCVWDVESGELVASLQGHTGAIWTMALSHAGDRVITGSEDHSSRIWSASTGEELVTLNEHAGPVWAVAFSPDDNEVVTGSYDSTLVTSDSWSGERHLLFSDRPSIVDSVVYSDNSKYLISGSADGHVKLWDRGAGRLIAEYEGHDDKVKNVMFTRDNKDILSCSDDGSVRMWSIRDAVRLD